MRSNSRHLAGVTLALAVIAACGAAWGQAGVAEASGEVVDRAGTPIEGAMIRFTPAGNPTQSYKGKTSKKGRYYIPGLFTPQENDTWIVEVVHEGYELVEAVIETRTVNKVLVIPGETFRAQDGKVSGFGIPKLGVAKVDLKLADAAQHAEQRLQKAAAAAAAAGAAAPGVGAAAPQPQKDPWLEATALAGAGEYEASIPLFAEAIEEDPTSLERHETFAKVLAHLERYDEARAQLESVLGLAPERVEARLLVAQVSMKQGDVETASAALEAVRAAAPDDVRVYEQLANLAAETGEQDDQITAYEAIARLRPADAQGWVALGDLYAKAGRMKDSEAAYQKVIDLDPQNAYRTYYNLAVFNLNREGATEDDRSRAIEALRRAVTIKPDYAQAYKELGLALLSAGDNPGAKQALEKYLSLKPDAPDKAQMLSIVATL